MNPFISFCLYVAARVFVQYLKSKSDDSAVVDSLRFLLSAMNALKRRNPLTESFLVQLDVDLEVLGSRIPKLKDAFPRSTDSVCPLPASTLTPQIRKLTTTQASPPKNNFHDMQAAPCEPEKGKGDHGILAYRNECHFLKTVDDDGNAANAPDLAVDTDPSPGGISQTPSSSTGLGSQQPWGHDLSSSANANLPPPLDTNNPRGVGTLPYSASMHGLLPRHSMDNNSPNAMSGTSGENNGPTPGSSSASDIRPQGADATAFFDPQFGMGATGLTPQFASPGNDQFSVPASWSEMTGGGVPGMTPVGDGVLRSMMNMDMDLGGWDTEINLP
jgi:hypothetical protein